MPDIVVVGGSVCGLATAMLLARDGHEVTVLERDSDPVPDSVDAAWEDWERKGVPQFRQAHVLFPRFRRDLEAELPEINDAMVAAGATKASFVDFLPPMITDRQARPNDDRFRYYNARRPVLERVVATAANDEPRVNIRRGTHVVEPLVGPAVIDGVPHVAGVRTDAGEELRADLVVDATGRRSAAADWITANGGRPPYEEAEDRGFAYYTRYFRGDALPQYVGPIVTEMGTITVLTFWGDNGTWGVVINTSSADRPLKKLRHNDTWMAVLASCPLQAHWADGEPISDVLPMSGQLDKYRRFALDGEPVVTGLAAVADAWCCTNPSAGRGLSMGLGHAIRLRDVVREYLGSPAVLAEAFDAVTEEELKPWYDDQVLSDRARVAQMDALREGRESPAPTGDAWQRRMALFSGLIHDPDVFRAAMSMVTCLERPDVVLSDDALLERSRKAAEAAGGEPFQMPGPSREQLMEIVS